MARAGARFQTILDRRVFSAVLRSETSAPGNDATIGGLKVVTRNGWFAARPSGTENIYKIYTESFAGADHLKQIQEEAKAIVGAALAGAE